MRIARLLRTVQGICWAATLWTGHHLAAQESTGSLRGRAVDSAGGPARSVKVEVSSRTLHGVRAATSDRDGYFQIIGLPPGEYTLRLASIGSRPVTIEHVTISIGRMTVLHPVALEAQPVQLAPIVVLAGRESIDASHTDLGGTISAADYEALPGERDYTSLITILPHITESHRGDPPNSAGSTGLENTYFIDGVNITSPLVAASGTRLPYNFVRALEVKTGGYEAQYGRALGAVVNAVTYSGTNDLEAAVFGFTSHSALAAAARAEPTLRRAKAFAYDVGVRVSGPILRNRLWYSSAYNPQVDRLDREIQGVGVFTDERTAHRFAGKLTWNPAPPTTLELSFFGDPTVHHTVDVPILAPAGYTPLNPDPYLSRVREGGVVATLRASTRLNDRVLMEAAVSHSSERQNRFGSTAVAQGSPILVDDVFQTVSGGNFEYSASKLRRSAAVLKGTVLLGAHTLTAGAEYEELAVTRDYGHPGGVFIQRLDTATYLATVESAAGEFKNRTPTAYLQDSWRLGDAVSLNAGIRWSSQVLTGASGGVAQRFPNEWQPRLGLVWQLGSPGVQRVFASFGRYYQQVPLGLSTFWYADIPYVESFYSVDPRTAGASPDSVFDSTTSEADWARSIPGLEVENSDEYTLGYERLLASSTRLTVRGLRRELRSSFQWGRDEVNGRWVLGTPGKGDFAFLPSPIREYTALELALEGMWHQVSYRASYVLSRNRGNYPGLYDSDLGIATPGGDRGFIAPHQATNSTGLLPNDRTHMFKLSGWHRSRFGLSAGIIFMLGSGTPLNAFAPGPGIPIFRAFTVQRGSAGRTPALTDLSLRLAYDLRPPGRALVRVLLDVLHLGNPQKAVRLEELRYLQNSDGQFSAENPSYQVPISYQAPMMARLGLEAGW